MLNDIERIAAKLLGWAVFEPGDSVPDCLFGARNSHWRFRVAVCYKLARPDMLYFTGGNPTIRGIVTAETGDSFQRIPFGRSWHNYPELPEG